MLSKISMCSCVFLALLFSSLALVITRSLYLLFTSQEPRAPHRISKRATSMVHMSNRNDSLISLIHYEEEHIQIRMFPCEIKPFPCHYLDIPLSLTKLDKEIIQPVLNVVANRLPTWKAGLLNSRGAPHPHQG
jgi:hypothetical protein